MLQKIVTIAGTRPEWIRLSRIIYKLDQLLGDNHIVIDTGQNYDKNLRDIFFAELGIRKPNYFMDVIGSFGKQIGTIIEKSEDLFKLIKPDKVLILGDTNSGLSAYVAERLQIPVYHCEAGNRSYDKELPEEINRKLIDHSSSFNMPYTSRSRENLLREGISPQSIFVSGNPILEVINHYFGEDTDILSKLNLTQRDYVVVTLHRSNNVDNPRRLTNILRGLAKIGDRGRNIIISTHPRTREKVNHLIEKFNHNIKFLEPMGFLDFITLQKNAQCILTDSGTVQEEACILKVPCVVVRKSTERLETIECGASVLSGVETDNIYSSYLYTHHMDTGWTVPEEYLYTNVSNRIINYLMGR